MLTNGGSVPRSLEHIMYRPTPPTPARALAPADTPFAVTGTTLQVSIVAESWDRPGTTETLACGTFEVDGITLEYGDAGSITTISGVSVPLQATIRREKKSRGWEDLTFRQIALDIATTGDLSLMYELDIDPHIARADQRNQSDLAFLQEWGKKFGATVKITNNRLIIFDEAKYEQRDSAFTFKRGDDRILSASFSQDSSNVCEQAEVTYKDPNSGRVATATFRPPNPPAVGVTWQTKVRPASMPIPSMS